MLANGGLAGHVTAGHFHPSHRARDKNAESRLHSHSASEHAENNSGVLTVFRDGGAGRPTSRGPPHRAGVFGPPAGDLQSAGLQHVCSTVAGWRRWEA